VDSKMGAYTAQGADGVTTVTHVFETPGPLYHKVKSVEKTTNGFTITVYKASYDEAGKLIREMDEKGYITNYMYGKGGNSFIKTHAMTTDPQTLSELAQKETALLAKIRKTEDPTQRGDLLEELGFLYAHQLQEPEKALALIPLMTNRMQIFNVKAHAIEGDFKLSDAEKVNKLEKLAQEFPEQQKLINTLVAISQNNLIKQNTN
jgi:hypothetical protein